MEPVGAFFDEEWESLSSFFSTEVSDNFLLHASNNNASLPNIISTDDENPFSDKVGGVHFHQDESSYTLESLDFYTMCYNNGPVFLEDGMQETVQLNQESSTNQITGNDNSEQLPTEDTCNDKPSKNPKKRSRVSEKRNVQKTKKPRKNKKGKQNEEQNKTETNGQSSNTGSSEEASNPSQEPSEESLSESNEFPNLSGKPRKTKRGSATDPQSMYARRRRERINEKVKILQNLVPNGTKVDLSTMLEDAVHYVKFLQLQIKLLSSDEMWMYSPIAYNGMDMGFYQNTILPNLLSLHN